MRALAEAPTLVPSAPSRPESKPVSTFWGIRPGAATDEGLPASPGTDKDGAPEKPAEKLAAPPPPLVPPRKPTESIRPTASANPPASTSELDTMQTLIDQLAAQLTAPKPEPQAAAPSDKPADSTSERAVDRSISALKSTGDVMRRSLGLGSLPRTTPPPLPPPAKTAASSPKPAPPKPATPKPSAPISTPAPAREPMSYRRLSEVEEAVSSERVDFYLDPILGLSDRKARHFEVSVRLRTEDGGTYERRQFAPIAQGTGILARIDAIKLQGTAKIATRLAARGTGATLFSNMAGESLSDDVFMESFDELVASAQGVGRRLVLAFSQEDVRTFTDAHWKAITAMARAGIRFALEEVTDLDMDFEKLKTSGFEFIKLDAEVFLAGLPAPGGAIPAADLCRHLSGLGLSLIVGAIEDEKNLAKILGFGVLFGQGTLFGGARKVKLDGETPAPQPLATLSR
jgi:cyclic-di-GMP phosphodiesterase TipF (flagellum assembly factor)